MSGLELLGLGWPEIAAAFGLSATAITLLYLVRRRRRVVTVPFVALFARALPDERTTRLFSRLKSLLSLLLLLLVAAAIAAALGLPRVAPPPGEGRTLVLVVDVSASMQARLAGGGGETRLDRVRRALLARIARLGASDRVAVLAAGARADVVEPLTDEAPLAARAIRALRASDAPGDGREALAWARDLCRDAERERRPCEAELYTDGGLRSLAEARAALEEDGVSTRVVLTPEGEPPNVAITALSARRFPADPTRAELLLELSSFAPAPTPLTLSIASDGRLVHRETLTLAPGARLRRTFSDLVGVDALIEARLAPPEGSAPLDALALDDVAHAQLAPRRRRRLLVVSPEGSANLYLGAALLIDPYLDVVERSLARYERGDYPSDRELVVFDRVTPPIAPRLPSLSLAPTGAGWLEVGAPIARPRFDVERAEHPLLAFVALRDVNIAAARPIVLRPGDTSVAGEARGTLLATGVRGDVPFVALAFDVQESDLPMRIAWPILVFDALSLLLPDDLTLAPTCASGRVCRLGLEAPSATLVRRGDAAAPIAIASRAGVASFELDRVGVYDLVTDARAADRVVVANLASSDESRLDLPPIEGAERLDEALTAEPEPASGADEAPSRARWPLHVALLAAALALLAFEWITFHRGWTT